MVLNIPTRYYAPLSIRDSKTKKKVSWHSLISDTPGQ